MSKNPSTPLELKISTVVAISAIVRVADPLVLDATLQQMTGGAPDFFDGDFVVLDVSALPDANLEWDRLVALFKKYQLHVVAVRGATAEMERRIRAAGLTLDQGSGVRPTPTEAAEAAALTEPAPLPSAVPAQPPLPAGPAAGAASATPAPAAPAPGAMIVDQPVRAGQRIYARGCDLIVTAAVNNGAEIISDGSIHVYAPLKGRALAGASGDAGARIFAQALEAELVSIAGVYRTFDDGFPPELARQPAQIRLVGDRLDIAGLGPAPRP